MVLIEGIWIRGLVEMRQCPTPYITSVSKMVMGIRSSQRNICNSNKWDSRSYAAHS